MTEHKVAHFSLAAKEVKIERPSGFDPVPLFEIRFGSWVVDLAGVGLVCVPARWHVEVCCGFFLFFVVVGSFISVFDVDVDISIPIFRKKHLIKPKSTMYPGPKKPILRMSTPQLQPLHYLPKAIASQAQFLFTIDAYPRYINLSICPSLLVAAPTGDPARFGIEEVRVGKRDAVRGEAPFGFVFEPDVEDAATLRVMFVEDEVAHFGSDS